MKKNCLIIPLALLLVMAGAACQGETDPAETDPPAEIESTGEPDVTMPPQINTIDGLTPETYPRVDGSTASIPLLVELYSRLCGVSPEDAETAVSVSGGTGAVWRGMLESRSDLLLVYEAPETVKREMADSGLSDELEITPIARDGLVFLVNSGNPVDSLTREQLVGIYTGEITDWAQVGGDEGEIAPFQRNEESGSQTLFLALLMGDAEPMDPPTEMVSTGMGELIDIVAAYDGSGGAIGYSVYYYAELMYDNPNLKLLAVDGVAPSAESISSGAYPLVNAVYTVLRKSEGENSPARMLRDYLHSPEGRQLLLDMYYVPVD